MSESANVPKSQRCRHCMLPIHDDPVVLSNGEKLHQFCNELLVAELADELEAALEESPDHEKLPDGKWRRIEA